MHIPTMGQVWSFTKSNLNFRAKKSVVIQDWRVGLMLRLLQLAVFLLTLAKLFINQEYLSDASPVVTLSMYGNEGEMPEALQREASVYHSNGTHPSALCTRVPLGLYDYVWSAGAAAAAQQAHRGRPLEHVFCGGESTTHKVCSRFVRGGVL